MFFFFYLKEKYELTLGDVLQIIQEPWTSVNNNRDLLRQAFGKFDESQEGYIDIDRFRTVMSTIGEPLTEEDVDALIELSSKEDPTKINIESKNFNISFESFELFFFRFTRPITSRTRLIKNFLSVVFFLSLCIET